MAVTAFKTSSVIGAREDLIDIIANISPTETPMFSSWAKVKATATKHEWQTDTISDGAANAQQEATQFSNYTWAATATVRRANNCQIFGKVFEVSGTTEAISKAGRDSEYAYQAKKAMKALAKDIEYAFLTGVGAAGATRKLSGIVEWVSSQVSTSVGLATNVLSEGYYNSILSQAFAQGGDPDTTYVGGIQKRRISAFTGASTRNIAAGDRRLVNSIDVYDSDYGLQAVILNRFMNAMPSGVSDGTVTAGALKNRILCLENGLCRVAMLRPIKIEELAKTGDSRRGMIIAELTLENLNPLAHAMGVSASTANI